jgi:hypothetical protein
MTIAGAVLILGVPEPLIDVFYFLNEGRSRVAQWPGSLRDDLHAGPGFPK